MRQNWVDIVKALTMISVVLGHISYQYPDYSLLPISAIIAWLWHVPVFFLVGGFFLADSKMMNPVGFIKGKIKTLYLPILYFYIPVTLMHNWLIDIGFYNTAIKYGGKSVSYYGDLDLVKKVGESIFLAGREPVLGAMWFAYVLFMALLYICIVTFLTQKCQKRTLGKTEGIRAVILLGGGIFFSLLTEIFGFTIPRFNNVFTAAWLIYVGMILNQKLNLTFQNKFVFVLSIMVFYSYSVLHGGIHLNHNDFGDIGTLTLSACSALYIVAFVAKKLNGRCAKILGRIGRDSFYIMALHFIAFKICSVFLNVLGGSFNTAVLEAPATNTILYAYYAIGGVFIPMLFIYLWRHAINFCKRQID